MMKIEDRVQEARSEIHEMKLRIANLEKENHLLREALEISISQIENAIQAETVPGQSQQQVPPLNIPNMNSIGASIGASIGGSNRSPIDEVSKAEE